MMRAVKSLQKDQVIGYKVHRKKNMYKSGHVSWFTARAFANQT